jgi:hypothetical protein
MAYIAPSMSAGRSLLRPYGKNLNRGGCPFEEGSGDRKQAARRKCLAKPSHSKMRNDRVIPSGARDLSSCESIAGR